MPFKEEREKGPKPKDPRTTFALEAKGLNFLFDPKALDRGCFVVVYVSSWYWKNVKVGHLSRKPPPPFFTWIHPMESWHHSPWHQMFHFCKSKVKKDIFYAITENEVQIMTYCMWMSACWTFIVHASVRWALSRSNQNNNRIFTFLHGIICDHVMLTPTSSSLHILFLGISSTNAKNVCYVTKSTLFPWHSTVQMWTTLLHILAKKIWSKSDHIS